MHSGGEKRHLNGSRQHEMMLPRAPASWRWKLCTFLRHRCGRTALIVIKVGWVSVLFSNITLHLQLLI